MWRRPGARARCLLDVPMDVFSQHIDPPSQAMSSRRPAYQRTAGSPDGIADAVAASPVSEGARDFRRQRRGAVGGIDGAAGSFGTLTMPVATTLMGKGVFPEDHPLACGMTGIWGTRVANETMRSADVIVAIGTAFGEADCSSWRPKHTFAFPPTKLIQIDIDPQEIGKVYPVDVGIVGDAKTVLRQLVDALLGFKLNADRRPAPSRHARSPSHQLECRTCGHQARCGQADSSGAPARRNREGRAA